MARPAKRSFFAPLAFAVADFGSPDCCAADFGAIVFAATDWVFADLFDARAVSCFEAAKRSDLPVAALPIALPWNLPAAGLVAACFATACVAALFACGPGFFCVAASAATETSRSALAAANAIKRRVCNRTGKQKLQLGGWGETTGENIGMNDFRKDRRGELLPSVAARKSRARSVACERVLINQLSLQRCAAQFVALSSMVTQRAIW